MDKISERGKETNKNVWNFIKPFMANKGMIASNDIILMIAKCQHRWVSNVRDI